MLLCPQCFARAGAVRAIYLPNVDAEAPLPPSETCRSVPEEKNEEEKLAISELSLSARSEREGSATVVSG